MMAMLIGASGRLERGGFVLLQLADLSTPLLCLPGALDLPAPITGLVWGGLVFQRVACGVGNTLVLLYRLPCSPDVTVVSRDSLRLAEGGLSPAFGMLTMDQYYDTS
jgi:hypothetical protein